MSDTKPRLSARVVALVLSGAGATAIGTACLHEAEGVRTTAYADSGNVTTICYGHTGPEVKPGLRVSQQQCDIWLDQDLKVALDAVDRHITRPLPDATRAAFASFVFNVGIGAFATSTLKRKANAGDLEGACYQLSRWVHVTINGKKSRLKGLENRRLSEQELCLMGLGKMP